MSVTNWILALLYAQKNFAMKGMLSFMKQLFLIVVSTKIVEYHVFQE
jgi:hypothetical protein